MLNKRKRMRLPNGFGQITEIKNSRLRNRYRVMITVGKNDIGKPICKLLKPKAYFATYNEAYAALIEYHKNPYELDKDITVKELYERWSKEHYPTLTQPSTKNLKNAWQYCSVVYDMKAKDLRVRHIKSCMSTGSIIKGKIKTPTPHTQNYIKTVFNNMLDYAVEYEIVDRNYARTFNLSPEVMKACTTVSNPHISFTDDEMNCLWNNLYNIPGVDILIIQCYTGWRAAEICSLTVDNVDMDNRLMFGGVKTESGKNRFVPIHSKIYPLIKIRYDDAISNNYSHIFRNKKSQKMTYNKYITLFKNIIHSLNLNKNHRTHDCRKQFVTMAKKYNVDEYAIKYIVGHSISDITEKIYTTRSLEWLKAEIEKIK